ncbi:MAG: ATP-binding cassette domain-containing protein [Flavobacteriales bacterium]|nr:ATP-binding cassette domain-containing protein [Flavobacteriales bacterium]
MDSLLSVRNVSKSFTGHQALNDVSLEVPPGSIFGLLGPNGAGKTTLIRIINQIIIPDNGQVYINGEPLRPHHVENIGYLPEERGLYRKMEVGEQALYLARLKGMDRKEAIKRLRYWFEKFGIEGWWRKKVEELSKGMQQKIQFITTVLHKPELLIFDEPFSGFDPINANLIKKEILQLRDEGSTILFSTHRMESVEELCDHIALINHSRKILDGSVDEVRRSYHKNTYTVTFTGNLLAFTNSLWGGAEVLKTMEKDGRNEVSVRLRNEHKPNDLLQAVIPYVEVIGFREEIPRMNEIFISKVEEIHGPDANPDLMNTANNDE